MNMAQKPNEEGMMRYSGLVTISPAAFLSGSTPKRWA